MVESIQLKELNLENMYYYFKSVNFKGLWQSGKKIRIMTKCS